MVLHVDMLAQLPVLSFITYQYHLLHTNTIYHMSIPPITYQYMTMTNIFIQATQQDVHTNNTQGDKERHSQTG